MRVTPLDIRKQEFRKVMRGLDAEEVYAFLQTVADEYEAVLSDNRSLRERLVELEDRLKEYKNIEMNLRNTLLTAEKLTAEAKENARREASLIVREAEVEAEKAAETIRAHTMQLRREILELKKQKDNYITRLKTLLDSHRKVLEGFEEDFSEVDFEIEKIGEQVEMDIKEATAPTRMSRKKITEDMDVGPKDKVTWGDERRREDEPRPSMPKPGWQGKDDPDRSAAPPEDNADSPAESEARTPSASQTGRGPSASEAGQPPSYMEQGDARQHVDTEPRGPFDRMDARRMGDGDRETEPRSGYEPDRGTTGDNGEARRIVEQSIAENLYPEARIDEPKRQGSKPEETDAPGRGSGGSQHVQPTEAEPAHRTPRMEGERQPYGGTPRAGAATREYPAEHSGVGTAVAEAPADEFLPETGTPVVQKAPDTSQHVELKQTQDDWKHYEVRDEKPDWSDYDIPRSEIVEEQASQPTDSEVEKALAGLKDISNAGLPENVSQTDINNEKPTVGAAPGVESRQDVKDAKPPKGAVFTEESRQDVKSDEPAASAPAQGSPQDVKTAKPPAATAAVSGEPSAPPVDRAQRREMKTEQPLAQAPVRESRQEARGEERSASEAAPEQPRDRQPENPTRPENRAPENEARQETTDNVKDAEPRDEEQEQNVQENNNWKSSFWSMDQLRRNLSNFIGREGEREKEQEEEQG